jgi:TatD DNase family protein
MTGLIDIGANLADKAFRGDLDAVLARAVDAGVEAILVTGTSALGSRRAREIAVERRTAPAPRLFATAGIHPHQARTASASVYDQLRSLLARPEVVAVGECGLDYARDLSPRDQQRSCFEAQLELATHVKKPVFLHEREAHEDLARALAHFRPRLAGGVVHCFTGDRRALERYLELDLFIGVTGWICDERRGRHLRELMRLIPEGRLLVETDAPYLLPRDMSSRPVSRRNEPAFLRHVATMVAACRGESLAELASHTTRAARDLFRIG